MPVKDGYRSIFFSSEVAGAKSHRHLGTNSPGVVSCAWESAPRCRNAHLAPPAQSFLFGWVLGCHPVTRRHRQLFSEFGLVDVGRVSANAPVLVECVDL